MLLTVYDDESNCIEMIITSTHCCIGYDVHHIPESKDDANDGDDDDDDGGDDDDISMTHCHCQCRFSLFIDLLHRYTSEYLHFTFSNTISLLSLSPRVGSWEAASSIAKDLIGWLSIEPVGYR